MATATTMAYSDGSTLTNFNAWANWIVEQFIAFGWTQTADSGQGAFPATGSVPAAAGYYAIFQSADALSSACKITVRMEFWASSNVPYLGLTVGTNGTDGAGNLISPFSTRFYGGGSSVNLQAYNSDTTNLLPLYASGDAGNMRLGLWFNTIESDLYNGAAIIISRSRDTSGNQTGNYVQVWTACSEARAFQTVFAPTVGITNNVDLNNAFIAAVPEVSGSNSWANGGAVLVAPVLQNIGGLSNPTPDLLVGSNKDFPPLVSTTVTVYGVAHNYIALSSQNFNTFLSGPQSSLLMRYE